VSRSRGGATRSGDTLRTGTSARPTRAARCGLIVGEGASGNDRRPPCQRCGGSRELRIRRSSRDAGQEQSGKHLGSLMMIRPRDGPKQEKLVRSCSVSICGLEHIAAPDPVESSWPPGARARLAKRQPFRVAPAANAETGRTRPALPGSSRTTGPRWRGLRPPQA